jgi:hypothetical protein
MLGGINEKFFEHPELWAYFYDQKTTGQPTATDRVRLQMIAEQLADALQAGLDTTVKLASYEWVAG